jgi:hypothetical protein
MRTKLLLLPLALALSGCPEEEEQTPVDPLAELATCAAAIQPHWNSQDATISNPRQVKWSEGSLFALSPKDELTDSASFVIQMISGDASKRLAQERWIDDFWIEGDRLLYAHDDVLRAVPLAGGAAETLVDGQTMVTTKGFLHYVFQAVDAESFYWTGFLNTFDPPAASWFEWAIWRAPRAGGPAEKLAKITEGVGDPPVSVPAALVLAGDSVVVADDRGNAWTVPRTGGTPVQFAVKAGDDLVAANAGGLLWQRPDTFEGQPRLALIHGPLPGMPQALWPTMPAAFRPRRAWADGGGGWFVSMDEPFGKVRHESLWHMEAHHQAARVACFSKAGETFGDAVGVSPEGVYVITGSPNRWGIGRIAR